jgi:hypothetical protein
VTDPRARPIETIQAPRRTLADPREQEPWFARLPDKKQDELRVAWAKEDARLVDWLAARTARCKESALDGGLVMLLPILFANLFAMGFLSVLGMLVLGFAAGAAAGAVVFVGRCGRFLAALTGMLAFLVVQVPLGGIGRDPLTVITFMVSWSLATYAYAAFGLMHEVRGRD